MLSLFYLIVGKEQQKDGLYVYTTVCTTDHKDSAKLLTTYANYSIGDIVSHPDITEYNSGWIWGYKAGWCYNKLNCLPPGFVPMCPNPRIGEDVDYTSGYNRGFAVALQNRELKRN